MEQEDRRDDIHDVLAIVPAKADQHGRGKVPEIPAPLGMFSALALCRIEVGQKAQQIPEEVHPKHGVLPVAHRIQGIEGKETGKECDAPEKGGAMRPAPQARQGIPP